MGNVCVKWETPTAFSSGKNIIFPDGKLKVFSLPADGVFIKIFPFEKGERCPFFFAKKK